MATTFASLEGLTAVVTGSSSGIGREIAHEFARAGAAVILHYHHSRTATRESSEQLMQAGHQVHALQADLGNAEELEKFVEEAWSVFHGVDVWVNNAGVDLLTGDGAQLSYTEKLQRLLDVDVRSSLLLSRMVGRRMCSAQGVILNIGWDQADRGMEGDSGELFATAKNAIMGATRSLAVSLAPNVRVNCIAPGWIRTAWGEQAGSNWQQRVHSETPLQCWGTPSDIARAARFLVSQDAAYITGQVINVNGGAVR